MNEVDNSTVLVASRIAGFVEKINESGLHGWAYDANATLQSAVLRFFIDGHFITDFECVHYRPDVQAAGHPRAEVGFHVEIPKEYFDGAEHYYHFSTIGGEEISLSTIDKSDQGGNSFAFDTYFDADFYRRYYQSPKDLSTQAAYIEWRNADPLEVRYPNSDMLLADLEKSAGELPDDFSPVLYKFLNPDIAGQLEKDWEARAHYLKVGRGEGRPYNFTLQTFIINLYFGGVKPELDVVEDFMATHGSNLYVSLDDLLNRNAITSDAFLRYLSVPDYVAGNIGASLKTKLDCIKHFAEIGLKKCAPLSFDNYFEYLFVAEINERYAALSSPEAYLHWINEGAASGIAPNHAIYLASLGLTNSSEYPADFDADVYVAKNPDLKGRFANRWTALRHFVEQGLAEGRQGCPIRPGNCDIYRAVADRLAVAGQLQSARRIYEGLLAEDGRHVLGNRHYGDCLLRLGEPFAAMRIYEQTIDGGFDNIWTHLNLTICHIKLQRWHDACAAMERISAARPGDRALQRRYREVLREGYTALAVDAHWLATNKFYEQAKRRMAEACALLTKPVLAASQPSKARCLIRSVGIIADLGLPQCKFYRVDQKLEQFAAAGIETAMIDYHDDVFKFVRDSVWVDAFIIYRVPATPDIVWAIWLLRKAGIPVFYEIDDLMFDSALFPDSFESYGGQISHELYATLITGSVSLAAAMAVCDYAIASTSPLAAAMEPLVLGKQAFVHRNGLSGLHQKSYLTGGHKGGRDKVRIFYGSGTKAHNEDFEVHLAEPLSRLLSKWGNKLELFVMGYLTLPRILRPYNDQISIHAPIWDLSSYWNVLREMDISVSVLKPGLIADCKSEIKWLEAAMLGVPSVLTETQTYLEVVKHGETALLANNGSTWCKHLDSLIEDRSKRVAMGQAARKSALEHYSTEALASNLLDIMDKVTVLPSAAKKRILIVNVFYPPQSIGGATRVVADNVSDLLTKYGQQVELQVFTTMEGGAEAYVPLTYITGGVRVIAVPTPPDADIDRKLWDEKMGGFFERVLDRFKPDLVHFHCIQRITISVCDATRRRGIPYVVTVHDGWWISDEQFLVDEYGVQQIYNYNDPLKEFNEGGASRLERMKVKQEYLAAAEKVLAVSEAFAKLYRECGFTNVVAIPNGVSALQVMPRTKSVDGRVRLAHVGGASFHKGYHLVRAALFEGEFANLDLLVIDHAMEPGTQRKAVWGQTPVTLRGKYPQSKVAELYSQVDVLLAPSIWPESYGLVAREALLAGCWVVASDRGAIGEDVNAENGFVVDVASATALTDVFSTISASPEKYRNGILQRPTLRPAVRQADDLALLYLELLG